MRGPDPLREGHRPARPATARLRAESALVRAGGHGLRTPGLDGDARPGRPGPGLGTQTAAAAPVLHRRAPGPRRSAPPAASRRDLPLSHPDHHPHPPPTTPPPTPPTTH